MAGHQHLLERCRTALVTVERLRDASHQFPAHLVLPQHDADRSPFPRDPPALQAGKEAAFFLPVMAAIDELAAERDHGAQPRRIKRPGLTGLAQAAGPTREDPR